MSTQKKRHEIIQDIVDAMDFPTLWIWKKAIDNRQRRPHQEQVFRLEKALERRQAVDA